MYLSACLAILLSLSCINGAKSSELSLKASPKVIVDSVTAEFTLECSPTALYDEENNKAIYMDIYKYDDMGASFVASQMADTTEIRVDNKTSAEGSLKSPNGEEPSFLKVSISEPSYSDEGVYKCRFFYLKDVHFKTVSHSVNVTVVEVPPPDAVPDLIEEDDVVGCGCDEIWDEINALKASIGTGNLAASPQYEDSCRVSFSAKFSDPRGNRIEKDGIAPFNDVISNKGGAFDVDKYAFVAPCDGQYFLSLTLRSQQELDSGYVDGSILVDGEEVARTSVFVDAPITNYESATNGAVVSLKQGQEVKVQIKSSSYGTLRGGAYSVFSGFYLFP